MSNKRTIGYKQRLKKCIVDGDFEGIVRNIMLMAVKSNTDEDWKASPRTFMELLQVLAKYRQEFGNEDMSDILKLVSGGGAVSEDSEDEDSEE